MKITMNKNPNNGLYNPLTNQSTEMILIFIIDNNKKMNGTAALVAPILTKALTNDIYVHM